MARWRAVAWARACLEHAKSDGTFSGNAIALALGNAVDEIAAIIAPEAPAAGPRT